MGMAAGAAYLVGRRLRLRNCLGRLHSVHAILVEPSTCWKKDGMLFYLGDNGMLSICSVTFFHQKLEGAVLHKNLISFSFFLFAPGTRKRLAHLCIKKERSS